MRRALTELDQAKRATLDLFYVEELSIADIALKQSRSVSAVKMELMRARRMLAALVVELSNPKKQPRASQTAAVEKGQE